MNQDNEHLHLLSIFHYVVAGMAAIFSLFPVVHLLVGIGMTVFALVDPQEAPFPIAFVGIFFIVFASILIICGLTFSTCLVLSGRFLERERHHKYCLVMAGISCIFMPFGTALGIFTIIELSKESVKAMFNGHDSKDAALP